MPTQEQQLNIPDGVIQKTSEKTVNPPYGKTVDYLTIDETETIPPAETNMFAVVQSIFHTIKDANNSGKSIKRRIRDINFLINYNSMLFESIEKNNRTTEKQNDSPDLFDLVQTGLMEIQLVNNGTFDKKDKQKKINKHCVFYSALFGDINLKASGKIEDAIKKLDGVLNADGVEESPKTTQKKNTTKKPMNKTPKIKTPNTKTTTRTKSRGRG